MRSGLGDADVVRAGLAPVGGGGGVTPIADEVVEGLVERKLKLSELVTHIPA